MIETSVHEIYMKRCFALAKMAGSETKTNPKVGAVIVHQNRIIGEGYHKMFGGNHAEINALNSVAEKDKHLIPQSSLYISLEPCNHFGKTPPCTQQIIKHSIKKVIVSAEDPNPLMKGKSITFLRENGVQVMPGVLEKMGKQLIQPFVINNTKKRPYVILKFAQSKDGYLGKRDKQVWLTNKVSQMLVHKWRSEVDGIMVGTNTAILDNPKLTTRLYPGNSPKRILIDRQGRIPLSHFLLTDDKETLIFTEKDRSFIDKHKRAILIDFDEKLLENLFKIVFENDVTHLIVEGGAKLLKSIIALNLWDEARVFKCSQMLENGIKAPILNGRLLEKKNLLSDELHIILNPNSA
jgi:diaminohydroxyphosphoribosylaminopyrimidine deaminase/5-amino-6-(5-phosphoribosylamino)uracil reductase